MARSSMARRMILYVDGTNRRLLQNPNTKQDGSLQPFITGEKITVDVVPLREVENGTNPSWEPDDSYQSDTFKLGLGLVDEAPDEGNYKITYSGDTSAEIKYNATASQLGTALNDMSSVTSDGGVTVTGDYEQGYRIRWNTVGAKTDFDEAEVNLLPESNLSFSNERDGDTNVKEVVQLRLIQKQAGLTTTHTTIPTGSMSVENKVTGVKSTRKVIDLTCVGDTPAVQQKEEFTCVAVGGVAGVAEILAIDVVADSAGSLDGTYFKVFDENGSVAFWFDHDNDDASPPSGAQSADRAVRVTGVSNDDTVDEVSTALASAIDADDSFTAESVGDRVIITHVYVGAGTDHAGTSGFTGTVLTEGVDAVTTDNYDGDYFYLYALQSDGSEVQHVFYFSQTAGATNPPSAAKARDGDLTEITYDTDATAVEMASTIANAINSKSNITAVASGSEVHITQDVGGSVSDGNEGDSNLTGWTVTRDGSDSTLDGKHFIAYETDGEGGEASRAFWFNISGNAEPSGTALTADATTEITTVSSGSKAYEVAEQVATVMDSLSTFSASAHGNKVNVESSVGFDFTTATAETSGFTVTNVQNGGAGTDANQVVEIVSSDQAIGGIFTLSIDTGNGVVQSGGIPWNAAPVEIIEILENMSNIPAGSVFVEGGFGGDIRLSFRGALAANEVTVTVDYAAMVWVQGFRFTLDLATTSAYSLTYGQDSIECVLELEATQGSAYSVKLLHANATLKNGLLDPSALSPSTAVDHYTSSEVDALIIHHEKSLSSLTGGSASDLDAIQTTSITTERAVFFYDADNSEYVIYVLKAGTEAESSPDIIRPDDFAASTNEKYWKRVDFNDPDSSVLLTNGSRAGTGIQEFLGLNLTDSNTLTLSSGSAARSQGYHTIAAESGTSDNLTSLTGASEGDLLLLQAATGDTITIEHNSGADQFHLTAEANLAISGNDVVAFVYNGTLWCEIGNAAESGSGSGDVVYREDITGLVGGTSSDLDSLTTSSLSVGTLYQINAGGCMLTYELVNQNQNTTQSCAAVTSTNKFTDSSHKLIAGQRVEFSATGSLPSGISSSVLYFVRDVTENDFKVSTTLDGSVVTFTTTGSGLSYRVKDTPFYVEPSDFDSSSNQKHWKLVAPFRTHYFEVLGPSTDFDEGDYIMFRPLEWMSLKSVALDMNSLPSGSGSASPEWVLEVNDGNSGEVQASEHAVTPVVSQTNIQTIETSLNYAVGSDVSQSTIIPRGRQFQLKCDDAGDASGAAVTGQGAIVALSFLYSHIGE